MRGNSGGGRGGSGNGSSGPRGNGPNSNNAQQSSSGNNGGTSHHDNFASGGNSAGGNFMQQQQDFSSWSRNPMTMNPADGTYNNFYYSGGHGYSPFPASGDMRDSIASIWSRTSPSGEAAYSSGYGQFPDSSNGQYAANSAPAAGQFAANLTGHFAASDMSMFGGDYSAAAAAAYGQQYNYGNQYTQWGDNPPPTRNGGTAPYPYMNMAHGEDGVGGGGGNRRGGQQHRGDRSSDLPQGMENMRLSRKSDTTGYSQQQTHQPKKMSWANVASQPAKPQPSTVKTKKPGVLPPPAMIPSAKPSVPVATSNDMEPPPPLDSKPDPSMMMNHSGPPPQGPSSYGHSPNQQQHHHHHHSSSQQQQQHHPHGDHPQQRGVNHNREESGAPQRNTMSNQGPRNNRVTSNGGERHGGGHAGNNSSSGGVRSGGGNGGGVSGNGSIGNAKIPIPKSHPILDNLKSLNDYNPMTFDMNPDGARFFVIKSFSEDDIHRSIKYEIWCSTDHGNKRLDAAFRENNNKGPIFLLFSVNGSGHFCGMAEMLSGVDYNTASNVWVQDKFKGQFKVKWHYVKDVPNGQLRHIRLENNENKPVTNSRDTQEVPYEKGKMVLKILHSYKHQTSIFDDFSHYEKRQEDEGKKHAGVIPGLNNGPPHHHQQQQQQHQHHDRGMNSNGGGGGGGRGRKIHSRH